MKRNSIPTAREMGIKLDYLSSLLMKEKLLQLPSKDYIDNISKRLKSLKQVKSWEYTIHSSKPLKFVPISDKKLGQIVPLVYIDVAINPQENILLGSIQQLKSSICH